jgi:hypothetical protein
MHIKENNGQAQDTEQMGGKMKEKHGKLELQRRLVRSSPATAITHRLRRDDDNDGLLRWRTAVVIRAQPGRPPRCDVPLDFALRQHCRFRHGHSHLYRTHVLLHRIALLALETRCLGLGACSGARTGQSYVCVLVHVKTGVMHRSTIRSWWHFTGDHHQLCRCR